MLVGALFKISYEVMSETYSYFWLYCAKVAQAFLELEQTVNLLAFDNKVRDEVDKRDQLEIPKVTLYRTQRRLKANLKVTHLIYPVGLASYHKIC